MASEYDARAFGALEAEVRLLRDKVEQQDKTLQEIRDLLTQAKGGWRTLMIVGGAAAALGATAGKILAFLGAR